MGEGSGPKGVALAFLLGSFAAGPLYGAFPFAAVLMKKGASFMNILVIAWAIKAALPQIEVDRLYAEAEHID
jgi:hypothetical protein